MSKYYITNDVWTVSGLEHELATGNSNDTPDGAVWLYLSPIYGGGHEPGNMGAWMATNGGPVLLATFDHDANLLWDESDQDWFGEALGYFDLDEADDLTNTINAALNK